MTLPTNQPINGSDDDSDMFGPPRSSPPIGYHHHRSKVPMISPKLRQREERKRIIQLCAHKLERIKDSEANLRRSVCINNTYSRLNDEVRREKQNRYLANLPKSDTKPETAHDNIFGTYDSCNGGNSSSNDDQQNDILASVTSTSTSNGGTTGSNHHPHHHYLQNDLMDIYPNLSHGYHHLHQSSLNSSSSYSLTIPETSSSCALTNLKSTTATSTLLLPQQQQLSTSSLLSASISSSQSASSSDLNSSINNSNLSQNSISSSVTSSLSSSSSCQLYSSSQSCSLNGNNTISTSTLLSPSISSTSISNGYEYSHKKDKDSIILSTTSSATTTQTTLDTCLHSVDTDLEILDRELSAIDASMPLIDPEITQGAEHLEKAISSRKRLRSEDENDRLVREALSQFYLPSTQRLISALDDCPLDIKRSKISSSSSSSSSSSVSMMCNSNSLNHHSMLNSNSNSSSSNSSHDLDLDLALDLNPSHKEFEVIMDALRLGTPSPTSSCGSDSCGQAAMLSESGGGIFNNLVVTSLET